MKRFLRSAVMAVIALPLVGTPAFAQSASAGIEQSGVVTPGHALKVITSGVAGDAGGAAGGLPGTGLTELGITNSGIGFCQNSGPTTLPYLALCLGYVGGVPTISENAYGGATQQPLDFNLNGTTYQFPMALSGIVGPASTTVGDVGVWNNGTGTLLKDDPPNNLLVTPAGGTVADTIANLFGRVFYAPAATGAANDQSAAINSVIATATAAGGGTVVFGPGTYGVCAAPVTVAATGPAYVSLVGQGQGTHITLQAGCATPPQEILLLNNSQGGSSYANSGTVRGLVLDGACTTKYVADIASANEVDFRDVQFANPAPAATIAGSAGVYMGPGNERKLGHSNFVTATNTCYNSGNQPAYGVYEDGGNDNLTGLIVVNFQTGIYNNGGDNQFGPGTHIWGGCQFSNGACTFDAALRTGTGLELVGSGYAFGVEVDDPVNYGIEMTHSSSSDRMIAVGTDCIFSGTPVSTQYCTIMQANVVGSVLYGTVAPQLAAAGFIGNIQWINGTGDTNDIIDGSPYSPVTAGTGALIHLSGTGVSFTAGTACIGVSGYITSNGTCENFGWQSPYGCTVTGVELSQDQPVPTGDTITYTVYDNGVATPIAWTLTAGQDTAGIRVGSSTIAPGDTVGIGITTTGSTTGTTDVRGAILGCG